MRTINSIHLLLQNSTICSLYFFFSTIFVRHVIKFFNQFATKANEIE